MKEEVNEKACVHCNEVMCSVCENKTCDDTHLNTLKCREWRDRRAGYYCGFQDGFKEGCDKANEWRYHGIPHDNRPYLCKVEQPTKYDKSEYEILFFDDKEMSWFRWLTLWSGEEGNETARINRKVIAWKEIVPPKLPKEGEK